MRGCVARNFRYEVLLRTPAGDVPADAQLDDLGVEAATSVDGISYDVLGHLGVSWAPESHRGAP
jgi:hypothetical protein